MMRQHEIAKKVEINKTAFTKHQTDKFGERYLQYRKQWGAETTLESIPEFPLYITIETSYKCNLACISCIHGALCSDHKKQLDKQYKESVMPQEVMQEILRQARENDLASIGLNWLGEPTLAKDIAERIQQCSDAGIMDIIMSTNGMLLTPSLSESIIRAGISHMLFSVDAASKETYDVTRVHGNFDKVNKNIAEFIRIRNEITGGPPPLTRTSLVPTMLNQHEITPFIEKYSSIVDYVEIQPFCKSFEELSELIPEGAEQYGFICDEVFKKATIDVNGDIHPCCSYYGRDIVLGNVMTDNIKDIFSSHPILKQIRKDALTQEYSLPGCQKCQKSLYRLAQVHN